eukprot:TRINITY_DN80544_c0_g1_i1.p1 TRINITY_DN80544_c0_g1~~TRINITY_DN80544_c0_g1_i1.p1  ORF type:complete len:163 (-),score=27.93 TRINITY_DN80544_c0_g1_i1:63-479(-)
MRNRGPGRWREWRWGQTVIPLYPPDKSDPVPDPETDPAGAKSLNDLAFQTISKLTAQGLQAKLSEGVAELATQPDSPGGRFKEGRVRDLLKQVCTDNLTQEEVDEVFPKPVEAEPAQASRKGSKAQTRRKSTSKEPTG